MGRETHLIVGHHETFDRIGPRVTSTLSLLERCQGNGRRGLATGPSGLTVSDSRPGRVLPHQSSPQGQTEVTAATPSEC